MKCGVNLGEERPNYAKQHLKQFPNHNSFLVKTLYDPLLLDNPDKWFKNRFIIRSPHAKKTAISMIRRLFTRIKPDKDFPEPLKDGFKYYVSFLVIR